MTNFTEKTDLQIDQWIQNHEKKGATGYPLYLDLLEERARRGEERSLLLLQHSLSLLRRAAIQQTCVSYGDLAKESGVEWSKARHRMNGRGGHLDHLLDVCFAKGLPMLPALCVNKGGIASGELDETALKGFADGARRLGFAVSEDRSFHHDQRDACWAWGKQQSAED